METWCNTTGACASGRPPDPYTTWPVMTTPWNASSATTLGSELPEVFRIEALEVGLERVRIEGRGAGLGPGLARLHRGEGQQGLAREYRSLESQGDGDRVRGTGVDLDHGVAAVDVELRVIGVFLHLRDDHLA